jgi:protein gp37
LNKLIRLGPSGIDYIDLVWNFYSGCRHKEQGKCPPVTCWAEETTKRFKDHYPKGFEPILYEEALWSPLYINKPSRIGVCFMSDLFGDWVDPDKPLRNYISGTFTLLGQVFQVILCTPEHTYVFLTKNPRGAIRWGRFPDNCEVGFSAWSPDTFIEGLREITKVEAKVKWCSLEPLLDWNTFVAGNAWELLDWVVIGALTGTKKQIMEAWSKYPLLTIRNLSARGLGQKARPEGNRWGLMPPIAWIKNIVEMCDTAGTKVFLKDNIWKWLREIPHDDLYWEDMSHLRQELPERVSL